MKIKGMGICHINVINKNVFFFFFSVSPSFPLPKTLLPERKKFLY